jgi:putative aldouronate transport system permease protein
LSSQRISIADICIYAVLLLLSFVCLFPFYYVVIVSIADPIVLLNKPFYVLPFSFNINSYRVLIDEKSIFTSKLISVFITAVGTLLSMLILIMAGYGLSKKEAPLRRFFLIMVLITMFFGGQLIPYYLLIKSLHLVNNLGVLIFPLLVDAFYLIIMKNYFLGVSASLEESAKIDGANDYRILFQIIVPISKPIIASISLFMAVSKWNEWWHAMLFLNDRAKWPMQMMLRETLANLTSSAASSIGRLMLAKYKTMNPLSVRMAAIMVTALPVLLIYPFVQKYFTKGLMIGSLKE